MGDFTSDVGRKKFGFSHEELEDAGAYYEGQFKLNMRSGQGVMHCVDTGAKYVGQFKEDTFHGTGNNTWSDGSTYVGAWKLGQKHGHGEYESVDGLRYVGQWEGGCRHGQGMQEYANGDVYDGWWFKGMTSGFGTYHFADGSRYEGTWACGRYDGPGVLYTSKGERERQTYVNGLLTKSESLQPGKAPSRAKRSGMVTAKAISTQARDHMHRPVQLAKPEVSRHLIHRETEHMDLSAPPLKPRTAPASSFTGALDVPDKEVAPRASTAPSQAREGL